MSDTSERDAVRAEFYARHAQAKTLSAVRVLVVADMADEIVRQRQRADRAERILAALREPSEGVVKAAWEHIISRGVTRMHDMNDIIRAAVAAAEQEVGP